MARRNWSVALGGLLAAACPAVLFTTAGPLGGAVGIVAVAAWLLSPPSGFAVGQAGLLLVASTDLPLSRLVGMEAALGLLLIAGLVRRREPIAVPAFLLTATVLAAGIGIGIYMDAATWQLAVGLLSFLGIAAYVLHRYELVAMSLVGEVTE